MPGRQGHTQKMNNSALPHLSAGLLLSQFQCICSFHLFASFQPLLFPVPCPSHRTLILAEADQSWDQRTDSKKSRPRRFRHFVPLTKFTVWAHRWVWMRKGIEIPDTAHVSASLGQPRLCTTWSFNPSMANPPKGRDTWNQTRKYLRRRQGTRSTPLFSVTQILIKNKDKS